MMDQNAKIVVLSALGVVTVAACVLAFTRRAGRSTLSEKPPSASFSSPSSTASSSLSKPNTGVVDGAPQQRKAKAAPAADETVESETPLEAERASTAAATGETAVPNGSSSRGLGGDSAVGATVSSGGGGGGGGVVEMNLTGEKGATSGEGPAEEEGTEAIVARFNKATSLAKKLIKGQRYDAAAEQYGIALSLCDQLPNHEGKRTALHNNRGAAFEKAGKYALALSECTICLAREDAHPFARVRKSRVLEALGKPIEALAEVCAHLLLERDRVHAKAAMSPTEPIAPPAPPANLEGLLQKVAADRADKILLERAAASAAADPAAVVKPKPLMKQAVTELLRSFGSFNQLERHYKGMQESVLTRELEEGGEMEEGGESPTSAGSDADASRVVSLLDRCRLRLVKHNYEGAREDVFEATEVLSKLLDDAGTSGDTGVPSDVEAGVWEWQGTFLQLMGRADKAMGAYMNCCSLWERDGKPSPADVLIKIAWVHMDKENIEEARASFARAIESEPEYGTCYGHRARLDAENEGLDVVKGYLEKAIALNKCDTFAWEQLARVNLQVGDIVQAMSAVEGGIKAVPKAAGLIALKAELMYSMAVRQGDTSSGVQLLLVFDEAIRADPSNAVHYISKAAYQLQMMQDVAGATEMLQKAVEVDPTSVSALLQLANLKIMVAKAMDEADDAVALLMKAVELCTTRDELVETLSVLVATEGRIQGARLLGRSSLG